MNLQPVNNAPHETRPRLGEQAATGTIDVDNGGDNPKVRTRFYQHVVAFRVEGPIGQALENRGSVPTSNTQRRGSLGKVPWAGS
jgi:hypothetical protein